MKYVFNENRETTERLYTQSKVIQELREGLNLMSAQTGNQVTQFSTLVN